MSTTHIHDLRRGVIELEAEGSLERVGSVAPEVSEIATRERFRSSGADSVAPVVFRERASGLRCVAVQESLVGFVEGTSRGMSGHSSVTGERARQHGRSVGVTISR